MWHILNAAISGTGKMRLVREDLQQMQRGQAMTETASKDYNWELLILLGILVAGLILAEELIFAAVHAKIIPCF